MNCPFTPTKKSDDIKPVAMHTITVGDRKDKHVTHTIEIPDGQGNWPIHHADAIYFHFKIDIKKFWVDHPDCFNPHIPSGAFKKGDKIGPFLPARHKTKVSFYYDKSEGETILGMHTIEIGD